MNKSILTFLFAFTILVSQAQVVSIPDTNFLNALIVAGIDTNNDKKIQITEAEATLYLYVSNSNIQDITGIEAFSNLEYFGCNYNQIKTLDLRNAPSLVALYCNNNLITDLKINNKSFLKYLTCGYNLISNLDVSNCPSLLNLSCDNNNLSVLTLPNSDSLQNLNCSYNKLSELNLDNKVFLEYLISHNNNLITLDLTNCNLLKSFDCSYNTLTKLDLRYLTNLNTFAGTKNPDLKEIKIKSSQVAKSSTWYKDDSCQWVIEYDNIYIPDSNFKNALIDVPNNVDINNDGEIQTNEAGLITSLNVSNYAIKDLTGIQAFTKLTSLNCSSNELSSINISNLTAIVSLNCSGNKIKVLDGLLPPKLTNLDCSKNLLQALNVGKYSTTLSMLNCSSNPSLGQICINYLQENKTNNWSKDPTAQWVICVSIVEIPDVNFKKALLDYSPKIDLNNNGEIELSEARIVTYLSLWSKDIYSVSGIEAFSALNTLSIYDNNISSLDLSYNNNLTELYCSSNIISNLNVTKNTALTKISCGSNRLGTLDISKNTNLIYLSFDNNNLSTIDLSQNVKLTALDCYSNRMTHLDLSYNRSLTDLWCSRNQITTIDLSNNLYLENLSCHNNNLSQLDISKNTSLKLLSCASNGIESIDLSKNKALVYFDGSHNNLTTLNLGSNVRLESIDCEVNNLKTLDLSLNTVLKTLSCSYNQLEQLNLNNNDALIALECDHNNLARLDIRHNTKLSTTNVRLNYQNNKFIFVVDCADFNATDNPNLSQICINNSQLSNTVYWTKDAFTEWSTSCIITDIEELNHFETDKKVVKIFSPLGHELKQEQATEGLYIYQFSDGSTKKVMRQK